MRLFKKPFSFSGRIQRVEYILTVVTAVLFPLISAGISYEYTRSESFAYAISSLLAIPSAWFLFAQGAKRCHDLGNSGWLQLILPISIWLMLFMKGEQQANEYGEPVTAPSSTERPARNSAKVSNTPVPEVCPSCRNPNTGKLAVCEWCGHNMA
jgi:uncharacterized membrane protein YhaH (DUF805 family)